MDPTVKASSNKTPITSSQTQSAVTQHKIQFDKDSMRKAINSWISDYNINFNLQQTDSFCNNSWPSSFPQICNVLQKLMLSHIFCLLMAKSLKTHEDTFLYQVTITEICRWSILHKTICWPGIPTVSCCIRVKCESAPCSFVNGACWYYKEQYGAFVHLSTLSTFWWTRDK